jgi:hypothetical protein
MKIDIVIPKVDYDTVHFWQGSYAIDFKYCHSSRLLLRRLELKAHLAWYGPTPCISW